MLRDQSSGKAESVFLPHQRSGDAITDMIKNILLDTDIGIDCDDAVALAVLLNLQKAERCFIAGTRYRRLAAVHLPQYARFAGITGWRCRPSEDTTESLLPADVKNVYAKGLAEKFGCSDAADDAVAVLRGKLASVAGRCTVVAIGPLSNIAALLRSQPDAFSPLTGVEIMREKAEALYFREAALTGRSGKNSILYRIFPPRKRLRRFARYRWSASRLKARQIF